MKTQNRKSYQRSSKSGLSVFSTKVCFSFTTIAIRKWYLCWRKGGTTDPEKAQPPGEGDNQLTSFKKLDVMKIEDYASSPRLPRKASFSAFNPISELAAETGYSGSDPSSETSSESVGDGSDKVFKVRKWPTRWYWQFLVLLVRTFRQSRHVILSKLNLLQTVILTVVASIIWFQLPKHEESISDRYGYVRVPHLSYYTCIHVLCYCSSSS